MKTTLDLPDELVREIKIRAVRENRTLKDLITDLLRRGLAQPLEGSGRVRSRVELPLVQCAHAAHPQEEMTPDRVARVLLDDETPGATGA